MEINLLRPYKPLITSNTRYYLLYGGRAGGRSYAGSQGAILETVTKSYSRIAIMRYIAGDIRDSIWRELKDRIEEYGLPEPTQDQAMRYEYNGNTIDAKGFKQSTGQNKAKLKSLAGYTTIVIDEADEIAEDDFDQLDTSIRTVKGDNKIILMFNLPDKNHWIIRRWFNLEQSGIEGYYNPVPKQRDDTTYMGATYLDNYNNLSQKSIETMENFKVVRPDYYYTMIKGLVSEGKRGRIYKHWKIISDKEYDELPYPKEYGLDFGFSNDPTSLVEIKRHNQNIYAKELIYETGMLNSHIADRMRTLGVNGLIRADSAEPKSIEELKQRGFNVVPADKGPDSIEYGVNYLNQHNVYYTESSNNIALETQNYTYALDKEKNPTNTPIDSWNHALDSIRYCCVTKKTNLVVL